MARSKAVLQNIDKSDPSNYLQGRIKDNTGSGGGTPVNEFVYGDMHQTFAKLMALYKIEYNGLPDNEQNGYQLIEALIGLASKNDFVMPLTSSGGVLSIPVKVGALKTDESFICKAAVDKTNETTVKGSLDNTTKAAAFSGDFKTGEYVQVINTGANILFIRLVNAANLDAVNTALKFLKAATQTEENTGTADGVATTPKTNAAAFTRRVNGVDSAGYLATTDRNGLLSKEDKLILENIGGSRIRNIGFFGGLDVKGQPVGTQYTTGGDIQSAINIDKIDNGEVIEVTFKNAMDNTNYKLDFSIQSQGNWRNDNDLNPIVWKPISTTKAQIYTEESTAGQQNLKIHIDVIQL